MKKPIETLTAVVTEPTFGYDLIRMYLGVALFVRGAMFIADPNRLTALMSPTGGWFLSTAIGHYVAMAHIGGGIMLALGVGTRVAAIVQLPVLAGAVLFVHWHDGLLAAGQSLELAGLVLFLLTIYAAFGAGPLSVDKRLSESDHAAIGETLRRAKARIRRKRALESAASHA
jgi:uncharacterized membrane protein YphA (DoxX/SURF4 family)